MDDITHIGLVELAGLRPPVNAAGFEAISADDLRSTAAKLVPALESSTPVALLAMQRAGVVSLRTFLNRAASRLPTEHPLVLLVPPDVEPFDVPKATVLRLPVRLSEALEAAGVSSPQAAAVLIDAQGEPQVAPGRSGPLTSADDWFDDDDDDDDDVEAPNQASERDHDRRSLHLAPDPTVNEELDPWGDPVQTNELAQRRPDHPSRHARGPSDGDPDDALDVAVGFGDHERPLGRDRFDPAPTPATAIRTQPAHPGRPSSRSWPNPAADDAQPAAASRPATVTDRRGYNETHSEPRERGAARPDWAAGAAEDPRQPDHRPNMAKAGTRDLSGSPDDVLDPMDLFGAVDDHRTGSRPAYSQHRVSELADVIVVVSGKGGTGKTTTAINTAQRAAEISPGTRVVLVDANRGQGDVRKYLRIPPTSPVRSVFDAAASGDPGSALLTAEEVNAARHPRLAPVKFSLALAPVKDQCDPALATANVYGSVIDLARRHSDLVVVDTQIVEAHDTTGLIDHLVIPLLADGAWGLAITDTSNAGVSNLLDVLTRFESRGVPADRMSLLVNRAVTQSSQDGVRRAFGDYVSGFGWINEDREITGLVNTGKFVHNHPEFVTSLDEVLFRMLTLAEFDPARHAKSARPRRRFFGRKR